MYNFKISLPEFSDNVAGLISQLRERDYSEVTILGYKEFLNVLKKYMDTSRLDFYTHEEGQKFLQIYNESHGIQIHGRRKNRAIVRRFDDFCSGGDWVQTVGFRKNTVSVPKMFSLHIQSYLAQCNIIGNKPITVNRKRQYAEEFVSKLNKMNCTSPEMLTPSIVLEACISFKFTGSWPFVAQFLSFLFESGVTKCDYSLFVPRHNRGIKLPSTYSEEEIMSAEHTFNRDTQLGARNYAMFLLSSRCGLRSGDIVLLTFKDISLKTGQLSIIQQKTEVPLTLTIPEEVLRSIKAYVSIFRPESSSQYIFISSMTPYGVLSPSVVHHIVSNALIEANVCTIGKKRGPHTLRASMATSMVNDDVPYEVIRKILGHANPETIKHYAKIHIEKLRECSLEVPEPTGLFSEYLKGGAL